MGRQIVLTEDQLYSIIRGVVSDDKNLMEYARVGFMENGLEVYVMTDDPEHIPHFHLRDVATKGREFDTCIEISRNRYFMHGHHCSKLNGKGKKMLAEFMEAKCPNPRYENNYELTVDMWNMNNSSMTVKYDKDNIPDYRELQ